MQHTQGIKPAVLKDLQVAFDIYDDVWFSDLCTDNNIDDDVISTLCRDYLPQGCFTDHSPWVAGADIKWPNRH